jgi:hypothetical protein
MMHDDEEPLVPALGRIDVSIEEQKKKMISDNSPE